MTDNWLQKTIDVPATVDDLIARYGTEQIDSITLSEAYKLAQATIALALNDGLQAAGGSMRRRRQMAGALFDKLLNGVAVVFMLGYDQARKEDSNAP